MDCGFMIVIVVVVRLWDGHDPPCPFSARMYRSAGPVGGWSVFSFGKEPAFYGRRKGEEGGGAKSVGQDYGRYIIASYVDWPPFFMSGTALCMRVYVLCSYFIGVLGKY